MPSQPSARFVCFKEIPRIRTLSPLDVQLYLAPDHSAIATTVKVNESLQLDRRKLGDFLRHFFPVAMANGARGAEKVRDRRGRVVRDHEGQWVGSQDASNRIHMRYHGHVDARRFPTILDRFKHCVPDLASTLAVSGEHQLELVEVGVYLDPRGTIDSRGNHRPNMLGNLELKFYQQDASGYQKYVVLNLHVRGTNNPRINGAQMDQLIIRKITDLRRAASLRRLNHALTVDTTNCQRMGYRENPDPRTQAGIKDNLRFCAQDLQVKLRDATRRHDAERLLRTQKEAEITRLEAQQAKHAAELARVQAEKQALEEQKAQMAAQIRQLMQGRKMSPGKRARTAHGSSPLLASRRQNGASPHSSPACSPRN